MARYSQTFERVDFKTRPLVTEEVEIVFETDVPFADEKFEDVLWAALWAKSGWDIKTWPAGFSSAMTKGNTRKL